MKLKTALGLMEGKQPWPVLTIRTPRGRILYTGGMETCPDNLLQSDIYQIDLEDEGWSIRIVMKG